jgi:ABC-type sulfate/molybdate transport systems ATPase subunit
VIESPWSQLASARPAVAAPTATQYRRRCGRSVALARVCYAAPSLALLDDPLSAVDAAVARRLWREAVRGKIDHRSQAAA